MQVKTADNKLIEIALRIREMREIIGLSEEEMAVSTDTTPEEYRVYETGIRKT